MDDYDDCRLDTENEIRGAIRRLEEMTGRVFTYNAMTDDVTEDDEDEVDSDEFTDEFDLPEPKPKLGIPSARLVIGVKLEDSQLYRLEKRGPKHHCPQVHNHPPQTDGDYCMWCGKPIYPERKQVALFDEKTLKSSPVLTAEIPSVTFPKTYTHSVSVRNLDVVYGKDKDGSLFAVVGRTLAISDNYACISPPSEATVEFIADGVRAFLQPHGLWDAGKFGVWLFMLR